MVQVEFTEAAQSDLARLDKPIAQRVLKKLRWLAENFEVVTLAQGRAHVLIVIAVVQAHALHPATKRRIVHQQRRAPLPPLPHPAQGGLAMHSRQNE